jgi:hypothetical protein
MARNDIFKAIREFDKVAATTLYNGPKAACERVVRELQQRGPAWSGEFSNSWQIQTPTAVNRGTGAAGTPQPIGTPALTGKQVAAAFFGKNKVVFTISNFSPHAGVAIDQEASVFIDPGTDPIKDVEKTGRRQKGIRGLLAGSGGNRRTAPYEWFTTYLRGGALDKAIKVVMDRSVR